MLIRGLVVTTLLDLKASQITPLTTLHGQRFCKHLSGSVDIIICIVVVLQLFGLNVHVNGLENLFLCLKFKINVFNTNNCLLIKQRKLILGLCTPRYGYYSSFLVTSRYIICRNVILIILTTIKMVKLCLKKINILDFFKWEE